LIVIIRAGEGFAKIFPVIPDGPLGPIRDPTLNVCLR
jgi:hypothetical protein